VNATLASICPLPKEWSQPTVVEDAIVADGVELHRVGFSSSGPGGEEVTGSAAEREASPRDRAYYELVERISTMDAIRRATPRYDTRTLDGRSAEQRPRTDIFPDSVAPDRWRYAKSNGVALHVDWHAASSRALWELCERDRVLRSWYGEIEPRPLAGALDSAPLARARSYEWLAYSFPVTEASSFSRGVHVCGVFGLPNAGAPFVLGFGARPSPDEALDAATREATQLLAFLWGEEPTTQDPPFAPTPLYHLDTFQRPERHRMVRAWLEGAHTRYRPSAPPAQGNDRVTFVDLTPPWLHGLVVSKAICPAAVPLTFGDAPFGTHLPPELRAHPIA